jgi:hypothetical protein
VSFILDLNKLIAVPMIAATATGAIGGRLCRVFAFGKDKEDSPMKRIVTLALMMLIGGYAAARAQDTLEEALVEENTKTEDAVNEFAGVKWGAGIGVIGGFGGDQAVEKASVVNGVVRVDEEDDLRPQLFLEMHAFTLIGADGKSWKKYRQDKRSYRSGMAQGNAGTDPTMPAPPMRGFGPFIALQSNDNEVIDALAVGVMWGFRMNPDKSASINIGIGLSFDPSIQVLGGGLKDGSPLPTGETEIRLKKESRFGWALMTSFTF